MRPKTGEKKENSMRRIQDIPSLYIFSILNTKVFVAGNCLMFIRVIYRNYRTREQENLIVLVLINFRYDAYCLSPVVLLASLCLQ